MWIIWYETRILIIWSSIPFISAKFKKPVLKRVKVTINQMLKTLLGDKGKQVDMRSQLKKHVVINEGKEEV